MEYNHENNFNHTISKSDQGKELYCEKDLGTTIVACVYDGGVILAADTRTSSGAYVANRAADKIWPIYKNIFALKSGNAAHTQFLLQIAKNYISQHATELGTLPQVKSAARILQQYHYQYKNFLSSSMIICGWDETEGACIYTCGMGGTMTKQKFAMSGSGSYVIHGFVDTHWKENMTRQQAEDFVIKAVTLAQYRDNSSGGLVRLVNIDKNGQTRDAKSYTELKFPEDL